MFVTGLSYDVCLRYVRTCKNNVSVNEDLEKFLIRMREDAII